MPRSAYAYALIGICTWFVAKSCGGQYPEGTCQMAYDDREALSVDECAKATGISRAAIYIHVTSGELPSIKLGRRRIVRRQALQAWLAALEWRTASNDDVHHRDREAACKARSKRGKET